MDIWNSYNAKFRHSSKSYHQYPIIDCLRRTAMYFGLAVIIHVGVLSRSGIEEDIHFIYHSMPPLFVCLADDTTNVCVGIIFFTNVILMIIYIQDIS